MSTIDPFKESPAFRGRGPASVAHLDDEAIDLGEDRMIRVLLELGDRGFQGLDPKGSHFWKYSAELTKRLPRLPSPGDP